MMLKDELKRILINQQTYLIKDLGVPRELPIKMLPKFATIISGIRRCGKSTLVRQYLHDKHPVYYTNFEEISLAAFELQDFVKLEEIGKEAVGNEGIFFFDEVQNIDGWERYIRQLVDREEKVIITGSNASMLSSELGSRLTGRHITKELYPFSYTEFLALKQARHSISLFEEYMQKGGFPEFLKTNDNDVLTNLFQDIFYRDVLQRNELRIESAIKTLLFYIISNIGKETSYNKLKKAMGIGSGNTISQFIYHFEQAYLLFSVRKFDYSLKKQMVNPKKIYCIDNAIIGKNAFSFSENKGRLLENAVFIELKRQGKEVYYYSNDFKCDFLIKEANQITQAIQVCFELNRDNKDREFRGLQQAMKEYDINEGIVLTFDQEDEILLDNLKISIMPVWKWLKT